MTRQRFITKWLGNEATKYTEEFRDLMRDDLDKVIDYHHKVNELNKSDVNGQLAEHECKFYVNASWTGYSRCECGKEHKG